MVSHRSERHDWIVAHVDLEQSLTNLYDSAGIHQDHDIDEEKL